MRNFKVTSLVDAFMSKKVRTEYFEVRTLNEDFLREEYYLNQFSEETVKALRALRDKYGKDEFFKHLDEVFEDEDDILDVTHGNEILSMDLDTPYYKYEFVTHELHDNGEMKSKRIPVCLSDEEYKQLLCDCVEFPKLTFNALRYYNHELYEKLIREIDWWYCYDDFYECHVPYLVTMDEVKQDAKEILDSHKELREKGCSCCCFFY